MSSTNKPERDWHDPPSVAAIEGLNPSIMQPQYQEDGKFNPALVPKWYRLIIIGTGYILLGIAIEIGLLLNFPIESLPPALVICGAAFAGYGFYSRRKNIEIKVGE